MIFTSHKSGANKFQGFTSRYFFGVGKKRAGFTLIEVIVATFIFVLVIAGVSQIFVQAFSGYRNGKIAQANLEAAQFAMNTIAKELRTSSIAKSGAKFVQFFDYSQTTCFRYQVNVASNILEVASDNKITSLADCVSKDFTLYSPVASGIVAGSFYVIPSSETDPKVGRVTLSLQVGTAVAHPADIQTTVSLRDYALVGI